MLFATHYLEEADLYADRIVLISNGSIVADGTGSEIKALASGRTVRATLTQPGHRRARPARRRRPRRGARRAGLRAAQDSDLVARYLLTETDARDLEITTHGLEDAFLSLTGRPRPTPRRAPPRPPHRPHAEGALR